jgi:putative hydrolase of the HAD superfamily
MHADAERKRLIKAVIFDYGLVLSGPRAQWAIDAALELTGLDFERFEELYWKFRGAYDDGTLNGAAYWRQSLEDARVPVTSEQVAKLVQLDGAMWCTQNDALVAWQQRLRAVGVKTAILSNMGDAVRGAIERECSWVHAIDLRIWSYEFGCTKPDARIYQHTLNRLGVEPEQALFLDDREENVSAARRCGMHALAFSTVPQLRGDLRATPVFTALPAI